MYKIMVTFKFYTLYISTSNSIFTTNIVCYYVCSFVHQNKLWLFWYVWMRSFVNCRVYQIYLLKYWSTLCIWCHRRAPPHVGGSNEALSRAPSSSMQPAGQPLHAIPPGRPGPGPAHRLRANALPAQQVRAARQVLTPNMASLLWRCDVNA